MSGKKRNKWKIDGARLKMLRESRGWTQTALAELTGLTQEAISRWEKGGRQPGRGEMFLLAEAFGHTVDNLMEHIKDVKGTKQRIDRILAERILLREEVAPYAQGTKTRRFPVLGRAPAGLPFPVTEEPEGEEDLPQEGTEQATRPYVVRASGDSMIGDQIQNGDYVIVDPDCPPREGDIVLALIHDEVTLKHIHYQNGRVRLVPSNPDFEPIEVAPEDVCVLAVALRSYQAGYARRWARS